MFIVPPNRIIAPDLDVQGEHCVTFYYHMYGFHIRTLQVLHLRLSNPSNPVQIAWAKHGQVDNNWHQGHVTVDFKRGDRVSYMNITCT